MFQGLQLCWHCQLLHWRVAQICLRFIMPQLLIGSSFAVSATASPHSSSLPECITSPRYWIFIIFQCCPGELSKKLLSKCEEKQLFQVAPSTPCCDVPFVKICRLLRWEVGKSSALLKTLWRALEQLRRTKMTNGKTWKSQRSGDRKHPWHH